MIIALTPAERALLVVTALEAVIAEMEALHETAPHAIAAYAGRIDEADTDLGRLLPKLRMSRNAVHLCGLFGRAP